MAVPRNPIVIDTSDTFSTWLSNTNLAINVLKNIITDTVLTHPSASAFTVGSTITQATTGATGIVQVSTTESTTLSDLGTGTWGTSNNVTQSSPTSVTVSAGDIDAVTVSHLATTNAALTTPTLTTPTIASNMVVNGNTLTLPTSADTLVGRATTDTLTNKTITGATISGGSMSGIAITNNAITSAPTISVDDGGTIGTDTDADAITIAAAGAVTFSQRDVHTLGITIANGTEIGSAGDPNAITISSGGVVAITATTANTSASDGALTIAGGLGVALDATIGDDLRLISDDAILSFGANSDVAFTHVHNDGLILKNTGANTTVLTIQSSDTDVADGNILGEIDFQAPSEGAGSDAILVSASIAARSEGDFSATNNATELVFKTGASEDASTGAADGDMILSSGGNLTVSGTITGTGGIDFSGTSNAAGMSSELLDDYEEGVYTATITCGSGTITLEGSTNSFAYTKIGRLVTLTGRINVSSISSPSGTANFNLPFTNTANLADQSEFALLNLFSARADVGTGYITLGAEIPGASSTTALIIYSRDADSWTGLDASDIAADAYFYLSGSYITD